MTVYRSDTSTKSADQTGLYNAPPPKKVNQGSNILGPAILAGLGITLLTKGHMGRNIAKDAEEKLMGVAKKEGHQATVEEIMNNNYSPEKQAKDIVKEKEKPLAVETPTDITKTAEYAEQKAKHEAAMNQIKS